MFHIVSTLKGHQMFLFFLQKVLKIICYHFYLQNLCSLWTLLFLSSPSCPFISLPRKILSMSDISMINSSSQSHNCFLFPIIFSFKSGLATISRYANTVRKYIRGISIGCFTSRPFLLYMQISSSQCIFTFYHESSVTIA